MLGPGVAVVVEFSQDDEHVENHAYLFIKLRSFFALLSDELANLLVSEPLKNFLDEPLLDIVYSKLVAKLNFLGIGTCICEFLNLFLFLLFDFLLEDSELVSLRFQQFDQVLTHNNPQIQRLALIQVLPEDLIVVPFEIAESQSDAFLVDAHQNVKVVRL